MDSNWQKHIQELDEILNEANETMEEENERLKQEIEQEIERLKRELNLWEKTATCRFNMLRALIKKCGGTVTVTKEELNIPDNVGILTEHARDGSYILSLATVN